MATRGVFQCQKLTLRYCEHGGSSRAVREYLASGKLLDWATERPTVEIRVRVANGKHPNLQADYATQAVSNKTASNGVASKPVIHQVCLKSKGVPQRDEIEAENNAKQWKHPVEAALNKLYDKSGRKMTKFTKPVYTQTPSIQGVWTPSLDLHMLPNEDGGEFDLKIVTAATNTSAS
uniref:Ribosomal protein/NADH dehydrogenase domain-containing protein n=1 Tax=Pseudo-nitzschia australis TaxID=44445 RepID=A0A7S4ARP5_9STRA|mmetsp:Transcript_2628/g.5691  ORF Transcript_2628/g.5691 Transcript_2628/m.5691 type:complete len:177 (-) Transcript_2628:403-933(-)|eukprot:CAMPEP_0168186802 /NCGR_PEP_ID=MMETSP0139_2-20121125/14647_1 /TAXON_ID=44445 /ORGANISM="Pseudo-nitzschia australis, Strain 10249 10 AB" /LENGTH=176 /DNA_ID=CAMNT_0008108875 /DNA_START=124 /DNA_END=654 /DNA_ORIENTATION=-